jgi:uncharacterized integral membrane protein
MSIIPKPLAALLPAVYDARKLWPAHISGGGIWQTNLMLLFLLVLLVGLLLGAGVSRWRERRIEPIWTWGLAFAFVWAWLLLRVSAHSFSWPAYLLLFGAAVFTGFLVCVVAAMTAGRGKKN